jgi:hypothetical protein
LIKRREDVAAATFYSWLFFMSVAALMTESIPHIWASFALHVIALIWSSSQVWATNKFHGDYDEIITGPNGACPGIDVISGYFKDRMTYLIATTAVNFLSTIASVYLCWRLFSVGVFRFLRHYRPALLHRKLNICFQMYGWLTFKKMGASRTIARAYKSALALGICIQLEIWFYVASVMCFLDQIAKGLLGSEPQNRTLILVGYSISTACVIPWLYMVGNLIPFTLVVSHLLM